MSLLPVFCGTYGQHATSLKVVLNDSLKSLYIQQTLEYHNTSGDTLREIYLSDWMNAFSDSRTPLAERFFEDYDRDFHFAREEKRGGTTIHSITGPHFETADWERPKGHPDLVRVVPREPLPPGAKTLLHLNYSVKIPSEDFTRFGYSGNGDYQLRYWFLTPGVYRDGWQVYSHKNMEDFFNPPLDLEITLELPSHLAAITPFEVVHSDRQSERNTFFLSGKNRVETELYLTHNIEFEEYEADSLQILTNIMGDGLSPVLKSSVITQIIEFLQENLGPYPHQKMISSYQDYAANPVYGLNQLPKFIRPFPEGFNYELQQVKNISENYLEHTLFLNPRKEGWVFDAIQTNLMMRYIETYYPDLKLLGSLSEFFGVRWFHASSLEFNDQYPLMYLYMARKNLDQPLTTPKDSLIKFNKNIANPYKAGTGVAYLESFMGKENVWSAIREFYTEHQLAAASAKDFEEALKAQSNEDIAWFFNDYIGTNKKMDFKIRHLEKEGDSLKVLIKNKTGTDMPVQVYGLRDWEVIYTTWVEDLPTMKTVKIPAAGIDRVAVNHEGVVPEINRRNNYWKVGGIMNKPVQLRLFQDIEDPRYNQLFLMPQFQYNLYDGLAVGPRIYNKTFLDRRFEFTLSPMYGLNSQTLVGGAGFSHQIFFQDDDLYAIRYGATGSRFSYGFDLFYERFTPFLTLSFRNSYLRNSSKEYINVRNVNVYRDQHPEMPLEVPDYSVFNINYTYSNPGLVEHVSGSLDFQLAQKFSKSSLTLEYKKLFENDRQLNLRFFGGAFIYNDLPDSDYFSFALDRPTDYLYDYNYYGRSETSGLYSQQIIMAEGGFKSMLEPQFANQWISTVNANATIWKWIFAYGDVGLVKNKHHPAQFLYDSGIRLSIVQNYFELYFPVYSSQGWEFTGGNYDQKIRFIATLDIQTVVGIFSREWF